MMWEVYGQTGTKAKVARESIYRMICEYQLVIRADSTFL